MIEYCPFRLWLAIALIPPASDRIRPTVASCTAKYKNKRKKLRNFDPVAAERAVVEKPGWGGRFGTGAPNRGAGKYG